MAKKTLDEHAMRTKVAKLILDGDLDLDTEDNGEVVFYTGFYDVGNGYSEEEPELSDEEVDDDDDDDDEDEIDEDEDS